MNSSSCAELPKRDGARPQTVGEEEGEQHVRVCSGETDAFAPRS